MDQVAPRFRDLARRLGASNDFFIRTTDAEHEAFVQQFVERMRAAGDIEKRTYGGLYCTACEGFYYERDLVEGKCPIHGTVPVWLEEENYYFLLSKYQDRLAELFRGDPEFVKPRSRYNEALSFIEQGLDDISISRSSITWGVPVPWDDEQVIYVWVDALINYLSALTYARPGEDLTESFWPVVHHLLAKDILKFHAVIWPALLMSAGYQVPQGEFIHGYLLMGGEKMSKTRGNVLDPFAVMDQYGLDALRYYLMREVTLGQDGVISTEGFESRYNNELANELGNLVSRTVSMIVKYRGGAIPAAAGVDVLAAVAAEGEDMVRAAGARYDAVEVTAALETIWEYVRRLNRLVEEEAPWKLAKDEAQAGRLDEVLRGLAAGLRLVALALHPVVPGTAEEILRRLGQPFGEVDLRLEKATWDGLTAATVTTAPPLFPASTRAEADRGRRRRPSHPMPMTLVDTHCHLDMIERPEAAVADARGAGVTAVVTIGIDLETSRTAVDLAGRLPGVYAAVGLHPHDATALSDDLVAELEALAARPRVVAIGECGLDFYRDLSPRDAQRRAFELQIDLARRLGLPLVVHVREAGDEAMGLLAERGTGLPVIMHCFSLPQYVDACNERGYYASFAGNVTYKNAGALREAAAAVREDRLLVETDAPFLAPVPNRGNSNVPAWVVHTAAAVAAARGLSAAECAAVTSANAARVFGFAEAPA